MARFSAALADSGRPLYLLDDGQEIERWLAWAGLSPEHVATLDLPTFGLGGEDLGRPAGLYVAGSSAPMAGQSGP